MFNDMAFHNSKLSPEAYVWALGPRAISHEFREQRPMHLGLRLGLDLGGLVFGPLGSLGAVSPPGPGPLLEPKGL